MEDFAAIKEQIRSRVDLVDLVSEHLTLTRRGSRHVGLCPFHQEKTPSFSVNADGQFFKCFGCGAGGDIFTFVQLRESVDFREALKILADRAGLEIGGIRGPKGGAPGRADIARVNEAAFQFYRKRLLDSKLGAQVRAYLSQRGISSDSATAFGLGVATGPGDALIQAMRAQRISTEQLSNAGLCRTSREGSFYDTFRERLMFPIRDAMKRVIGFGGRTLGDDPAKYINTPQTALFDKSKCLYGIDLARQSIGNAGWAVVVEGYTDCIAAHQHGFLNTVATLGTAATEEQMGLLRRYADEVVLVFDSDAAGEAASERALAIALRNNLTVKLASVPESKDPAEFLKVVGPHKFSGMLNSADEALRFCWKRTLDRYGAADSPGARRKAVLDFTDVIVGLVDVEAVDAIQLGEIINQLSRLLSVPEREVRHLLLDRRKRSGPTKTTGSSGDHVEGSTAGVAAKAMSGEQAALLSILEVVLSAPEHYPRVAEVLVPERFLNPIHGRICRRMRNLVERAGRFSVSDLLLEIDDPSEASALTELVIRGGRLGNSEHTLCGALERLRQVDLLRGTRHLRAELRQSDASQGALDETTRERLARFEEAWAKPRHFAPRGVIEERCNSGAAGD